MNKFVGGWREVILLPRYMYGHETTAVGDASGRKSTNSCIQYHIDLHLFYRPDQKGATSISGLSTLDKETFSHQKTTSLFGSLKKNV